MCLIIHILILVNRLYNMSPQVYRGCHLVVFCRGLLLVDFFIQYSLGYNDTIAPVPVK